VSKKQLRAWFADAEDLLAEVDVDGERSFVLAADLDELLATSPTKTVRLLGGFDQYVLGPGTDDDRVLPSARRWSVSKQSGWIAPVVVAGGVIRGTWTLDGDDAKVSWFAEAGRAPRTALAAEVERLGGIVGRDLRIRVTVEPLP
jgi:hypothetical protein